MKTLIIAVDFDGTLCEESFPRIGAENGALILQLKHLQEEGHKLILWTCRAGEQLKEAVDWCRFRGLEFAAVNENLPEHIAQYGGDTRKVYADMYIDDKAAEPREWAVAGRLWELTREV